MKRKLEPIGKQASQHRHLLIMVGPDITRRHGKNVVVVGADPCRTAGDGSRVEIVSSRDQQLQRVVLFDKPIRSLHGNEAAALWLGIYRLDGRHFKRVEFRARGRGLRQHSTSGNSQRG